VQTLREVRPVREVTVVGRDPDRAARLADAVTASGLPASVGKADDVARADIVVCATTAPEPLFDGAALRPEACVVAVGSHEPDRREVGADVLRRAADGGGVVVESRAVAMREAGDVVLAVGEGALAEERLVDLASVVRRERRTPGLSVFKSVGMGWQDLVVAEAVLAAVAGGPR
jgi:ornithine cyclodeaminase